MELANTVVSKKRMREVSVQFTVPSDAEKEGWQAVQRHASHQETAVSAFHSNVPLSRKQRRKHLRSVSKQSSSQLLEPRQDTQDRAPSCSSSGVPSATTSPEDELLSDSDVTAEASKAIKVNEKAGPEVLKPKGIKHLRPEPPRRTQTDGQLFLTSVLTASSVLKAIHSSPSPLPQTISYAAALTGSKTTQESKVSLDWVDATKDRIGRANAYEEALVQPNFDKQEESDTHTSPQDLRRKKRIRIRKRKSRQSTTESTVTSKEDDQITLADTSATTPTDRGSPIKEYRTRQHSITFSIADTLIEEGNSNLEERRWSV
ncbi:hypothetical protein ONS96_005603 [Cadophora gregata f. sp. sojae]|nr:hypothetical protein ONS96_005603 [Cadophora gregata f. sp. sojae]